MSTDVPAPIYAPVVSRNITLPQVGQASRSVPLLGEYLLASKLVTPLQLSRAARTQYRWQARLGDVLVAQGSITPMALVDILLRQSLDRLQGPNPLPRYLGEHLLQRKLITPDQLAAALFSQIVNQQRGKEVRLGALLVNQRGIDQQQLVTVLSHLNSRSLLTDTQIVVDLASSEPLV